MGGNHNSGGARVGAGRKRKPIAEKIAEGERGQRNMTVMQFDNLPKMVGLPMPKHNEILSDVQNDGTILQATELYKSTWGWLEERGCATLISPQLLDRYAMATARWIHCEETISATGYLGQHPTTGSAIQSPYISIGQSYMQISNKLWNEIFNIVRENCLKTLTDTSPQDDLMEKMLRKGGG